jgi:polyhydroxyalkanoate synthesis regulator phasin
VRRRITLPLATFAAMTASADADRLMQQIRELVADTRRADVDRRHELQARGREIERLKAQLAEIVKRTAR